MGTRSLQSRFNISNRQAVNLISDAACLVQVFAKIAELRGWRQASTYLRSKGKDFAGPPPYEVLWNAPICSDARIDITKAWLRIKHQAELPSFAKAKVEVLTRPHL